MMNYSRSNELTRDLLPGEILRVRTTADQLNDMESPAEKEKKMIEKMVDLNFHKTVIAEKLKVSRATLYRKIKKYDIAVSK